MWTKRLRIAGMTCGSCADLVEGALRKIGAEGKADLSIQTVRVEYNEAVVSSSIEER
ncbi:copper chaperone [Paenibacillus mucilaginosus]|uniref:heavy-metal-associated domain-containing protein n=1 Tax=Paenibacillus mucilaginosus TaxID=61624 RepID=UPI003D2325DA